MLRIALQRRYCAVPCFLGQPVFTSKEFCIFAPFGIFLCFLYLCFSVFSGFTEETRCCAVFSRSTRVYQSRIPMEVESVRFSCISVELIGIAVK